VTAGLHRRGLPQKGLALLFRPSLNYPSLAKSLAAARPVALPPVKSDDSNIQMVVEAQTMRDILIEEPVDKYLSESSTILEYKLMMQPVGSQM